MALQRRTVHYSGRVQGVGFRWTTMRALEGLPLTGYIKNLVDGRVELVLEGQAGDADAAVRRIRQTLGSYIDDEAEAVAPATGEFPGFGIRR